MLKRCLDLSKLYKITHYLGVFLMVMGVISGIAIKVLSYKASLLSPAFNSWSTAVAFLVFFACFLSGLLLFLVKALLKMMEKEFVEKEGE